MSKLGETLKDLAPGLIGGAVGAVSPQAGASLTNAIGMADGFKQRRRRQAIEDERLIREEAKFSDYNDDRTYIEGERDRTATNRQDMVDLATEQHGAGSLGALFAEGAPVAYAQGEMASERSDSKFLRGVMTEEQFAAKNSEINDPGNPEFGQRITSKVQDADGNVSTRYLVPKHMQGSQVDPNSLTKKDKYRYQGDYQGALTDIRSVFREQGDIANMRTGLDSRPVYSNTEGMTPEEMFKYEQGDWDYQNKARGGLIDRERKSQAALDQAINRALNAGAMLGQSPEDTFAQIREVTGLNIAPGYDPYSDDTSVAGVGSGDGESLAATYSGDDIQ